jgi:Zn-dependent protease
MALLGHLDQALQLLPGLLVGLTVHEFAHAWSSSLLGDDFARRQGRVSLNPVRHLTLLGALAILLLPFGWGKPVPVNLYNYKHPRRDYLLTSLAGPASNLLIVGLGLGLLHLTRRTYALGDGAAGWMMQAHMLLMMGVYINGMLAIFNLIPIPPLDGSKIWPCLLGQTASFTAKSSRWLMIVVVVLMVNGTLSPAFRVVGDGLESMMPTPDRMVVRDKFHAGQKAYHAGQLDLAEQLVSEALAVHPRSESALVSRANIRTDRRNWHGALADIDAAIRIAPTHAEYYRQRAEIRVFLGQTKEIQEDMATYHRLGGQEAETPQAAEGSVE